MLNWPFQPAAQLAVQGWGFWLAIAGLIISVVGFWITLVQLARTRKAASAVSDEVQRIKFAVSKYDATVETSRAESSLESARKSVRAGEWSQATEPLESLSKSLHTLRQLQVPELSIHEDTISNMISHANKLCERIDANSGTGLNEQDRNKTLSSMREHDRNLTSLRIALQRSSISE